MITIFGATGHTGGAAAAYLLRSGKKVRVVGRQRDKLAALVKAGAEGCVGDIEDTRFVREALAGADGAYALIPPNMVTDDFRAYERRVVDSVASAVEAVGLRHLVLLSSIGAEHGEGTGPIVGVHEFEERLKKIPSLNTIFLRAGYFMENVFAGLGPIKAQGIYPGPMPAEAGMAMVASSDIGTYAGLRLEKLDFTGQSPIYILGPKVVSQTELVSIVGQAIGKPVQYVQVSLADLEHGMLQAGLKPSLASVFIEMYQGAAKGLLAPQAGLPIVNGPTSFETFCKTVFAPAFAT